MDETRWKQVNIAYASQNDGTREGEAISHLARTLLPAEAEGLVTAWFFIRKGPWRIRYQGADAVHSRLTDGVTWTTEVYEPEAHAFGGPDAMDAAHKLFHDDSRNILTYLSRAPLDRRERSLVLSTALMRSAGLEFYEQGDVWARLADQRAALLSDLPDPKTWESFTRDVRRLLTGSARREEIGGAWLTAFEEAGATLRMLRQNGQLTRGIRAVIALHVIFHWNRTGIPGAVQASLARAAKEAIFD